MKKGKLRNFLLAEGFKLAKEYGYNNVDLDGRVYKNINLDNMRLKEYPNKIIWSSDGGRIEVNCGYGVGVVVEGDGFSCEVRFSDIGTDDDYRVYNVESYEEKGFAIASIIISRFLKVEGR